MEIYNVGPHQLSEEYDLQQVKAGCYEWLVYWYEAGYYEGDGEAIALGKDGNLYYTGLGHCSCYGPMDNWSESQQHLQVFTVAELFGETANVLNSPFAHGEVEMKVRELLAKNSGGR